GRGGAPRRRREAGASTGKPRRCRNPITFRVCSRPAPRPCTVITQVSRGPGTNQAGRGPSSPATGTSAWSSPRAVPGSPMCRPGVSRTRLPGSRAPRVTLSSRRTTVSAVSDAPASTGPTTAWTPSPERPYRPGRRAARCRVRVTRPAAVPCTVSRGSVGRGLPAGALRAASLASRPAATAAAPAPITAVTAAAVALTVRTRPVSRRTAPRAGGPVHPGCRPGLPGRHPAGRDRAPAAPPGRTPSPRLPVPPQALSHLGDLLPGQQGRGQAGDGGGGEPEPAHPLQLRGAVVRLVEGGAVGEGAVVAQEAAGAVPQGVEHVLRQLVRPVGGVGGDADGAAERRGHVVDRREFVDERGDGRRVHGVGVDHGAGAGRAVDRQVHGQLAGRDQRAEDLPPAQVDAGDVLGAQPVVGHPRGGDEHGVADPHRDVAGGADDESVGDRAAGGCDEFRPRAGLHVTHVTLWIVVPFAGSVPSAGRFLLCHAEILPGPLRRPGPGAARSAKAVRTQGFRGVTQCVRPAERHPPLPVTVAPVPVHLPFTRVTYVRRANDLERLPG